MKQRGLGWVGIVLLTACTFVGCASSEHTVCEEAEWPTTITQNEADEQRTLTVVVALSSVVPGGVIGHAGVAVDQRYWDFGPQRVQAKPLQAMKSVNSPAGPWWSDPDQRWNDERTLSEVLEALPEKVHPDGSLVAVFQAQITNEQAHVVTAFWQDTYQRMRDGDDRYRLAARQCASMVCWSIASVMPLPQSPVFDKTLPEDHLPVELHLMTPTALYETLAAHLNHTAGPDAGEPADLTLWQLGPDGLTPWERPELWNRLDLPELPRTRIAIERIKHLPASVRDKIESAVQRPTRPPK